MVALLAISTLISLALAQTTSFKIPYPDGDSQPPGDLQEVSVVTVNKATTVLQMKCPTATPDCGLFPYQTLTYGPSTWKLDMSVDGNGFTMTQDCSFGGGSAVCKESASGSEANFPGSSTTTYSDGSIFVMATAGVDKLVAGASASPTPSSLKGAGASQSPAATGARASGSGSPSGTSATGAKQTGAASRTGLGLFGVGAGVLAGLVL